MQINITRKSAGLSDSLRTYIESKLGGLDNRFDKVIDAKVLMNEHGRENSVEINLHVTGANVFAKDQSTNLRAAFDSCIDKLDKQLSKKKEKMRRKSLTQQEAILSGKVFVESDRENDIQGSLGQPVLLFDPDEEEEEPEQLTGT